MSRSGLWRLAGVAIVAVLITAGVSAIVALSRLGDAIEGLGALGTSVRTDPPRASFAPRLDPPAVGLDAPPAGSTVTEPSAETVGPESSESAASAGRAERPSSSEVEVDVEDEAARAELADVLAADPEARAALEAFLDELDPEDRDEDLDFLLESIRDGEQ